MRYFGFALLLIANAIWAAPATFEEGLRLKNAQQLQQSAMVFKQVVAADPGNVAALEQLAIVYSWMNQYDESIAVWNRVIQLDGNRAGVRVSLARVLFWKRDREQSLTILNAELQRHPKDADALALRGDVLLAEEQFRAARQSYQQALQAGGSSSELEKKIANALEPPKWRIDAGYSSDHYSNERGTESGQYAQVGYSITAHDGVYFHYDHLKEFGVTDNSYWLGLYGLIGSSLSLTGEFSITPNAYFRPSTLFNVNAELVQSTTWQPLLGIRYMHYDTKPIPNTPAVGGQGNVTTVTPGLRYIINTVGNVEVRYGLTHNIDGSNTGVAQGRFNIDPVGAFTPYIAIAHGKEALPPQPAATFTVVSAGGVYQFSSRWSGRLDVAYEDRKDFYNHSTVALGASAKF